MPDFKVSLVGAPSCHYRTVGLEARLLRSAGSFLHLRLFQKKDLEVGSKIVYMFINWHFENCYTGTPAHPAAAGG
jgi:hypothetical protein